MKTLGKIVLGLVLFVLVVLVGAGSVALIVGPDSDKAYVTDLDHPTSPTPSPPKKFDTIGEGTWKVGEDVSPGEYRTSGARKADIPMCYWHTAKTSGDDKIVDQGVVDSVDEPGLVTLKDGQYFKTMGCEPWNKADAASWLPKVSDRKVYVIETLPSNWPVRSAMNWIDRYTGSNWVMAKFCPKTAYRCITVRKGNLAAPRLAETRGASSTRVTIVVDLPYANPRVKSSSAKRWVMAHEFGHAAGLTEHAGSCSNLMYANTKCMGYRLSASQKRQMAIR